MRQGDIKRTRDFLLKNLRSSMHVTLFIGLAVFFKVNANALKPGRKVLPYSFKNGPSLPIGQKLKGFYRRYLNRR